ncbi:iron ABC transporter ATpase [Fictibacillus macauensis ZFHKF-1]|uniref:Carnitine transport ATP-binding protein OpuCA n=1 Tax=Fictibacillus macauensis ZFHKF-1 TaxID=1196324 RepID=I8UD70_9BACL|nr:ABC transporter ATP-binding protein [Fictibacillus macauensis]EIT84875.1 iron ABC transporter ATpase [Fictibacillus macauensis ZFHKF-1]
MMALRITDLCKSFDGQTVLNNVALELPKGKLLAILGPSGCGKTTLLRSIAGFEMPSTGTIEIAGVSVFSDKKQLPAEKRRVGYVPQEGALFPHLTVAQNIAFGLSRQTRNQRVKEMLALVGMEGFEKRMPHELSGGQQQRIALARALAPHPELILLDEPFSALDTGLRAQLREDIKYALEQAGATAIMVTHDQEEAFSMADRIAIMRDGKLVQTADPDAVYTTPSDVHVATFVGDAVILKGQVNGNLVECPLGSLCYQGSSHSREAVTVMIRPEQVTIGSAQSGVIAKVTKTIYFGHDSLIHLELEHSEQHCTPAIRVLGKPPVKKGDLVGLQVNGDVVIYG